MAKILAPNKYYTGASASVNFVNGIGDTEKPELIDWFKKHGYKVIEKEKTLEEMSVEELLDYANKNNIDIGKATSQAGILEKIKITQGTTNNGE